MATWLGVGVALAALWLAAVVVSGMAAWHAIDRRQLVGHVFALGYRCGRLDECGRTDEEATREWEGLL